jgi:hypothetical protein
LPTLKRIVERNDTRWGRVFDFCILSLVVVSLVSFSLETLPNLSSTSHRWLYAIEVVTVTCPLQTSPRPERELGQMDATEGGHFMPRAKKHTAEEIIPKLRAAELEIAKGRTAAETAKKIGVTERRTTVGEKSTVDCGRTRRSG